MITGFNHKDQRAEAAQSMTFGHSGRMSAIISILLLAALWLSGLAAWRGIFTTHSVASATGDTSAIGASQQSATDQLPLAFVPNEGQISEEIMFQARAMGGMLSFTSQQVIFNLPGGKVALQFEGANPDTQVWGEDLLLGVVNYYADKDPAKWRTDLPTYGYLVYQQLYPGIDLRYEGTEGRLKGTYLVAPGADPARISWQYSGAAATRVDPLSGDLQVQLAKAAETGENLLIERAPLVWQESAGERIPVDARYSISEGGMVSFELGAYDSTLPLIIDPDLVYSSYLGGTLPDDAYTVAVDGQGNAFISGSTLSTDFLDYPGTSGTEDVWIVKLNAAGSAALYTTYLVGNDSERPDDIALDSNGNAYLTGYTGSANFPTLNATQPDLAGGWDFFATKLNPQGQLVFSTFLGTIYTEEPAGIAVDAQGQLHITGMINGRAVIYKLAADGNLLYGALYGGSTYGQTAGTGIAVNSAGEVYLTGETGQKDLGVTPGAFQDECDGIVNEYRSCRGDIFLTKLNNANRLEDLEVLFSSYYGGLSSDHPEDLRLDANGYVYLAGTTISVDFPVTANAYQASCPSGTDPSNTEQCLNFEAFVVKLEPDFGGIVYSTYFGADYKDYAKAIAYDSSGAAYITGWTEGNDLPLLNEIQDHAGGICYTYANYPRFCIDSYVAKFDPAGALVYNTYLGGISDDFTDDIAAEVDGDVYVVGNTLSTNFPTTAGSIQADIPNPGRHGFVSKIGQGNEPPPPVCYQLSKTTTGSGAMPTASPANSSGCTAGMYLAGENIQLTASPATGWRVLNWNGTTNDASTAMVNYVSMPASNHTVTVNYAQIPPSNPDFTLYLPQIQGP
jgi:hypothetical protein